MKSKLGLGTRPKHEMQLICNCCLQSYYSKKSRQERIEAILFGAEKYVICPLCSQPVPDDVLHDEGYRQRCDYEVVRLQQLFESESKTHLSKVNHTTRPTYEELKAKLAELEAKQRGGVTFKVSAKGGLSVYGVDRFPVTLYYEQWVRLLDKAQELRGFLEANKSKMKLKDQLKATKKKKRKREDVHVVQGGLPSLGKKR